MVYTYFLPEVLKKQNLGTLQTHKFSSLLWSQKGAAAGGAARVGPAVAVRLRAARTSNGGPAGDVRCAVVPATKKGGHRLVKKWGET